MNAFTDTTALASGMVSVEGYTGEITAQAVTAEPAPLPVPAEADGVELFYQINETIFGAVAAHMVDLGWSVFPQERHGNRQPCSIYGERIRWSAEFDLKNSRPSADVLKLWTRHAPAGNVACVFGPASGDTFAIDIDVKDPEFSGAVRDLAFEMLGETPFVRVGQAPKMALIYRQPEGGEKRVRSRSDMFAEMADDGKGNKVSVASEHGIEILADGKLLTFHGVHHRTGGYFRWHPATTGALIQGPETAPLVTVEQVDAFMNAVAARWPLFKSQGYSGGPVSFGDVGGIRLPKLSQGYKKHKESGLITDGREKLLADLAFMAVKGNGWQILEASGDHALNALIGKIAAAVAAEFGRCASLDGRWTGESLKREVVGKVSQVARKVRDGKITPAAITAAERQDNTPEVLAARRAERKGKPYSALGSDLGSYFFVDRHSQIRSFSARKLEETSTLFELAPPAFWQGHYGTEKGGVATDAAANALMEECRECGVYNPDNITGRGAWWVQGKALFNEGTRVFYDNVEHTPGLVADRICPRSKGLGIPANVKPLTAEEAGFLFELTNRWQWRDQEGMSILAAAAIAQATVCGALEWRTHFFITAEAGSGKTQLMSTAAKILGPLAVQAMGDSTAKGLAQHLRHDALCVLMDEPEVTTESSREQVQEILTFFRRASSDTTAQTLKGTSDQKGTTYRNQSMGILASIQSPITQDADLSRWVPLNMVVRGSEGERSAAWRETQAMIAGIPEDFGIRLMARMLWLLPVIRANTKVFAAAIAQNGGTGRMGMNLGVPLAVACALDSDNVLTDDQAKDWLARTTWVGETIKETKPTKEWQRVFSHLSQHRLDIKIGQGSEFVQIGECLGTVAGLSTRLGAHLHTEVRQALAEALIRVDGEGADAVVSIATDSVEVAAAMRGTLWAKGWNSVVKNADEAESKKVRFSPVKASNATRVPLRVFLGLDDEMVAAVTPQPQDSNVVAMPAPAYRHSEVLPEPKVIRGAAKARQEQDYAAWKKANKPA